MCIHVCNIHIYIYVCLQGLHLIRYFSEFTSSFETCTCANTSIGSAPAWTFISDPPPPRLSGELLPKSTNLFLGHPPYKNHLAQRCVRHHEHGRWRRVRTHCNADLCKLTHIHPYFTSEYSVATAADSQLRSWEMVRYDLPFGNIVCTVYGLGFRGGRARIRSWVASDRGKECNSRDMARRA